LAVDVVCAPPNVDAHVAADRPTPFLQPPQECRKARLPFWVVRSPIHEHADVPHPLALLRARPQRPPGSTAAEKCDQFPPPPGAYPKAKEHRVSIAGAARAGPPAEIVGPRSCSGDP